MPSVSERQRRFMAAAAYLPEFAKKAGSPQSVAQEYNQADKRKLAKALRKRDNPSKE